MGAIIAGNQMIDRNLTGVTTNVPGGVANLFTRRQHQLWSKPAGAGYYLQFNQARGTRLRVFGLLMPMGGIVGSALTFTVRFRTGTGLGGGLLVASYQFDFDHTTGIDIGDMTDLWMVLPPNAPALSTISGTPTYCTIEFPAAALQFWRLFAGDYVDISDNLQSGWSVQMIDPNEAQSVAPGSSYTRSFDTYGAARRRKFVGALSMLSDAQAWGPDIGGLSPCWSTSIAEIFASQGSTGEVVLLNRIGVDRASNFMTAADAQAIASHGIYGHLVRGGGLRMAGSGMDGTDGKAVDALLWNSSALEIDSLNIQYAS